MSKRASISQTPRLAKPAGSDTGKKKTGAASKISSLDQIKEGDVYYKTSRIYPSIQDHAAEDDVILAVTRPADLTKESPVLAPSAQGNTKKSADSRRGSVLHQVSRDEIATPAADDRSD